MNMIVEGVKRNGSIHDPNHSVRLDWDELVAGFNAKATGNEVYTEEMLRCAVEKDCGKIILAIWDERKRLDALKRKT